MHIILYILGAIAIIILAVSIYCIATNQMYLYWKIIRFFKRREVLPHMESICQINRSITETNSIIYNNDTSEGLLNKVKSVAIKSKQK